jgi:lysozyme family protein
MNADDVISDIIRREGHEATNITGDRGGWTKYGITLDTLRAYRGMECTSQDILALQETEARNIYRTRYVAVWPPMDGDLLALLADYAVHSGVRTAATALQAALGVRVDGVIGAATEAALRAAEPASVRREVLRHRIRFVGRLISRDPTQARFAAGWLNRIAEFL